MDRCAIRRQQGASIAPPANRAAPEQLLAPPGAPLYLEAFTGDGRTRLRDRRRCTTPPWLALPRGSIHGGVQPPVVLAPPVTEEVLVRPFADLDDRRPTVFHQLREEVERNADVVGD